MHSKVNLATFIFILIHFISPVCAEDIRLETGCYFVVQNGGKNCVTLKLTNAKDVFHCLNTTPIFTAKNIADVSLASFESKGKEECALHIILDDAGRTKFSTATGTYIGKRIALVIDGLLVMAPIVQGKIDSGVLQLNTLHHSQGDILRFYEYLNKIVGRN